MLLSSLKAFVRYLLSEPYSNKLPCPHCARILKPLTTDPGNDLHCPRCRTFYTTTHDLDYFDMPLNFRITGSYVQKKELSRATHGQP
jgi:hypothetical protein